MRVLFCHDGPLSKDKDGFYYGVAHNNEMFSRYFAIADEIRTAIRIRNITSELESEQLSKITLCRFSVFECKMDSNIKGLFLHRRKLKKLLYNEILESDYIIIRLPSNIGLIAINIAKHIGRPYLIECVGCPWDVFWNHSLKGKLIAPIMFFFNKMAIKKASWVIYVSNIFLQKRYPTKGMNISCSDVDLPIFDENTIKNRIKKINETKSFLTLGTLGAVDIRYKGQEYVIKALAKLKKEGIHYRYQLVGSGNHDYLYLLAKKLGIENNIEFLGPMPHNEVYDWLDSIDIYIQPSLTEGLPRALLEAMSRGCPVIGSKAGGIPELIDNEFIFNRKSVSGLTKILREINKDNLIKQAKINFEKSKEYSKELLEIKRNNFFKTFIN